MKSLLNCESFDHELALAVFPGGVNSPVRSCRAVDIKPPVVSYAYGDSFKDIYGEEYIDFCGSWGALIHGHAHPIIVETIVNTASKGISYGLTSSCEIACADLLLKSLNKTNGYKVRFVSTGTEATMTAVRLAKGVTGRSCVIMFDGGYHGHGDVFLEGISITYENKKEWLSIVNSQDKCSLLRLPYNNIDLLQEIMDLLGDKVACVIFEPIASNMGVILPKEGFLHAIVDNCKKYGCISIADEVVTGFRVALGGAQELLKFQADITVFGKIIGGGTPTAAIVAKDSIMDYLAPQGNVFQAGTFSGNPMSMSVSKVAMELCHDENFYEDLESKVVCFINPIQDFIQSQDYPLTISRMGSMFTFFFTEALPTSLSDVKQMDIDKFKYFYQLLFNEGVYFSPSPFETCFISLAHSYENLEYAQKTVIDSLRKCFSI